ncbi:hypothetical protein SteCoe_1918 [Stentor coeruleus]|uniref:Uncharacterized protein n=1 Tax=Stentor coeruleus TaxID=5963 RepID=A0A1R2D0U8_9CILI|nr:hypothetical protein SteCoe_1918 [Stentor coeruleus]
MHHLKIQNSFSPSMELYKKLHYNPKIYKLSKIFNKKALNYVHLETPRRQSLDFGPTPKYKKTQKPSLQINTKIPHLPKLPILQENKNIYVCESHNLKLSKKNKAKDKILGSKNHRYSNSRNSSSIIKASVQMFDFNPLDEFRLSTFAKISVKNLDDKLEKSKDDDDEVVIEKNKRKIIFSKRNQSSNVKDIESFLEIQDLHKGSSSSLSKLQ